MIVTDPIADMITRIRNALRVHHPRVEMPASRLKGEIAKALKEQGYISNYKVSEENRKKTLRITLKYNSGQSPAITKIIRVSKPGRRVYRSHTNLPSVLGGLGHSILTTPRGVMTGQKARKLGVGGELLFEVW
ncbi:MAG: 30S ribosomal protein S8 [Acidobacteria bacterium RIFCSPLOWO2_02_FULL_59_13]|nr:MAG: 30S ribosomal protein S8 [Acidobacteria bacterium RIFCSPLOWO2_02_FULL_59_13]